MNRNLVGSTYGRFYIKIPQNRMKGERHRLSGSTLVKKLFLFSGIIRFTQAVKMYEKQDQEVTLLNRELKSFLIPSMNIIPPENTT